MVDIDHQKRQRHAGTLTAAPFPRQHVVETAAIGDIGERVGRQQPLQQEALRELDAQRPEALQRIRGDEVERIGERNPEQAPRQNFRRHLALRNHNPPDLTPAPRRQRPEQSTRQSAPVHTGRRSEPWQAPRQNFRRHLALRNHNPPDRRHRRRQRPEQSTRQSAPADTDRQSGSWRR